MFNINLPTRNAINFGLHFSLPQGTSLVLDDLKINKLLKPDKKFLNY